MKQKARKSGKKQPLQPNEELRKLGARIKQLRIERGYSSYEYFAYDHNISRAQFGRYEQGQDLRYTSLVKVVDALGITMKEFFEGL